VTDARVKLWGRTLGAVSWDTQRGLGVFQYAPEFMASPVEPSPIVMPKANTSYEFPAIRAPGTEDDSFHGLPGLLSDSIPDKFGNALIDRWLVSQGRTADSMNPVERLCYVGKRGMGALEYVPAVRKGMSLTINVDIATLVELANEIVNERSGLKQILSVGTSAGGARAKAVLAWNPETGAFKSGQLSAPPGFEHWLLKFEGVADSGGREISDPQGYGRIEYAYYLMARSCGIEMMPSRLHEEGGRAHFMTRRFDRIGDSKLHMQSLCALCHYDFNQARAYSYEQAIQACRSLQLGTKEIEQQVRRAFFNVLARNQDDHSKNIAFMMDKAGRWRLSPAYDVTYAFNPDKFWTREHQMSLNEKTDHFETNDLMAFAKFAGLKNSRAKSLLVSVSTAVANWSEFAREAEVTSDRVSQIKDAHRSSLFI
jgi:serine/threonine-protein kinase HipA